MNKAFRQHSESHSIKDERGAAALMIMVIILAVAVLLVSSTAFIGVDDLEIGFAEQAGSHALIAAESCADEAILRLSRDNTYVGGSLIVGESTCTVIVTGVPCGSCTIAVTSARDSFTRRLEVGVDVSGSDVVITSWEEVD